MCTSWAIQSVAASLLDGASARLPPNANRIRSTRPASTLLPDRAAPIAVSIPRRRHNPSSRCAPPNGREPLNVNCAGPVNAAAPPGSSSRDNAVIRRSIAGRPTSSSRPKECSTFVRETPASGSHSLWASCRYRTACPVLFFRDDTRTYTWLDGTGITAARQDPFPEIVSLGVFVVLASRQLRDLHVYMIRVPRTPRNCGTQGLVPGTDSTAATIAVRMIW